MVVYLERGGSLILSRGTRQVADLLLVVYLRPYNETSTEFCKVLGELSNTLAYLVVTLPVLGAYDLPHIVGDLSTIVLGMIAPTIAAVAALKAPVASALSMLHKAAVAASRFVNVPAQVGGWADGTTSIVATMVSKEVTDQLQSRAHRQSEKCLTSHAAESGLRPRSSSLITGASSSRGQDHGSHLHHVSDMMRHQDGLDGDEGGGASFHSLPKHLLLLLFLLLPFMTGNGQRSPH